MEPPFQACWSLCKRESKSLGSSPGNLMFQPEVTRYLEAHNQIELVPWPLRPPPTRVGQRGTPATCCQRGEWVLGVITIEEQRGKSSSGWWWGVSCHGAAQQAGVSCGVPKACADPPAGICNASAEGEAATRGLEQKEEARESASPCFSLWLWAGSCRHPSDLGSGILMGPKDKVPEEGNGLVLTFLWGQAVEGLRDMVKTGA